MSNVLNEEKKQQVIALGRLGWSLRRIQRDYRRSSRNGGRYLKAAGIASAHLAAGDVTPAKPANEVITDSAPTKTGSLRSVSVPAPAKPANEVITDFGAELDRQYTPRAA